MNKLLCEQVSIRASIIARLDKMGDVLLKVPLPVELLKLWRLIARGIRKLSILLVYGCEYIRVL